MKKLFYLSQLIIALTIILPMNLFGQVGINTKKPAAHTGLHVSERKDPSNAVPDKYNGIIIQRYTTAERDAQLTPNMGAAQNSLLIFNTTEGCYNFWSSIDNSWQSLCGKLGKSTFTFDCSQISVNGTYIAGKALTTSNYLSIPVNVTKAGEYSITVTTANGYNFYTSSTFLSTGTFVVQVPGQGTPVNAQTDNLAFASNGNSVTCNPVRTITVLSSSGTYTMGCNTATVNGVYKQGTALTASNTISLPVNVTSLGSYQIMSNTVDGISFSGSGVFTSLGAQTVTLTGSGTPTSTTDKVITLTSNSAVGSASCNVTVKMTVTTKKILQIDGGYTYGYAATQGASRSFLQSQNNFGLLPASIVKTDGFTYTTLTFPSSAQLLTALNSKPDIVIIGYYYLPDQTAVGYLTDYLNNKGVVINFNEETAAVQRITRSVLSNPSVTATYGGPAGSVYQLTNTSDPILNGPFGDVRGKSWGEDNSTTVYINGATDITTYSYAQPLNSTTIYDGITGFRHNSLNYIWFGDAGFLSNNNTNGTEPANYNTLLPFVAPSSGNYFPVYKNYGYAGNGYTAGSLRAYNSVIFGNIMAWAIKQAEVNGINTP